MLELLTAGYVTTGVLDGEIEKNWFLNDEYNIPYSDSCWGIILSLALHFAPGASVYSKCVWQLSFNSYSSKPKIYFPAHH